MKNQSSAKKAKVLCLILFIAALIVVLFAVTFSKKKPSQSTVASSSETYTKAAEESSADEAATEVNTEAEHKKEVIDGITYIDGIMIVNKSYSLPEDYDPGLDPTAEAAFEQMQQAASEDGLLITILSGYRSYSEQEYQYNVHVENKGKEVADEVSARPGYSEHQSGLCMDINSTEDSFADTEEAKWLAENCVSYGFIIRFPEGKEEYTGYSYEPWHIRYVGVENAKKISESGLCLEEYLGVESKYAD